MEQNILSRIKLPAIQVALDLDADVKTIYEIAVKAYAGEARLIEAGTPAIKRHGADLLIPALRRAISLYCRQKKVPNEVIIIADFKTMDAGDVEARIAYRAGADIISILGIGSINKVKEALKEAKKNNKMMMIDLIQCPDPLAKLEELTKELEGYEDYVIFCIHKGISEQIQEGDVGRIFDLLKEVKRKSGGFLLSVAGGINEKNIKNLAAVGADIYIVGRAIYNSTDPKSTTKRILEKIKKSRR